MCPSVQHEVTAVEDRAKHRPRSFLRNKTPNRSYHISYHNRFCSDLGLFGSKRRAESFVFKHLELKSVKSVKIDIQSGFPTCRPAAADNNISSVVIVAICWHPQVYDTA